MKHLLLPLLLLAAGLPLSAQMRLLTAEELSALRNLPEPAQADTLLEWAYDPARRQREAVYALAALEMADRSRHAERRSDAFVKLGNLALDAGRYEEATGWLERGLHIRDSLGLISKAAGCYNNLGLVQQKLSRFDSAAALCLRGLDILQSAQEESNAAHLHNTLGTALRSQGRYEDALLHFREAMSIYSRCNNATGAANARLNIGNLLQDHLGRFREAKDSLQRCLDDFSAPANTAYLGKCFLALGNNAYYLGEMSRALEYADQVLALGEAIQRNDRAIALKNKARYLLDQQRFREALPLFEEALRAFTDMGNAREIASTQAEIGHFYYEKADPATAIRYYHAALDSTVQDLALRSRVLYFLSDAYDQTARKDSAAHYMEQFVGALRALRAQPSNALYEELTFFSIFKSRVKTEMALRASQQTRAYATAGILGVLLLASFLVYRQRQQRRLAEQSAELARQEQEIARREAEKAQQDAELARQHEQIAVQEKVELLKSREVETTYARLQAQDEMQQRIGRELHDNIGAMLTTVRLRLAPVDEVLDALPGDTRQEFEAANHLLQEACEELRRLSHQLSSATLMQFGLEPQLRALADNTPLKVNLELFGLEKRLDFNVELNIYRIIQELLQNVIKHARAQNVNIAINRFPDRVNILVEDDGRGFDPRQLRNKPGIGLQNLAARLNELNGQMEIDAAPGRGTNVIIDIRLKKDHSASL